MLMRWNPLCISIFPAVIFLNKSLPFNGCHCIRINSNSLAKQTLSFKTWNLYFIHSYLQKFHHYTPLILSIADYVSFPDILWALWLLHLSSFYFNSLKCSSYLSQPGITLLSIQSLLIVSFLMRCIYWGRRVSVPPYSSCMYVEHFLTTVSF